MLVRTATWLDQEKLTVVLILGSLLLMLQGPIADQISHMRLGQLESLRSGSLTTRLR